MTHQYKTRGTCSSMITFDIEDGILKNVCFTGGCNGNLKGIAKLTEGMNAKEVAERIKGVKCGFKNTSCPDQLALAIEEALKQEEAK